MPEALGLGEKTMQNILDPAVAASTYGIGLLATLSLAKLLASVSCLGLRYPGGVFSPALFMGAALGRLPIALLITALPDQTAMELCTPVKQFLQKSDDLWTGFLAMEDLVGHTLPVVEDNKPGVPELR